MVHNLRKNLRKHLAAFAVAGVMLLSGVQPLIAGEPEYIKLHDNKPFVFSAGVGYGISNNPCKNCDEKATIGGATIAVSLGYKINDKFKIEFGPSFWIQGSDLFNKNVADSERPNNKRTMVTFTGTYTISPALPLSVRLGGGAGILNFTPAKTTVTLEENKFAETEIFKGFSGTFGLAYEFQLSPKIKFYPSVNLWYIHIEEPAIIYNSYIDYKQASYTTDLRISFNYNF